MVQNILESGSNFFIDMKMGENILSVHLINSSESSQTVKNCDVYGFKVNKSLEGNQMFEIFGGIKIGSSTKDVEKVYGIKSASQGKYSEGDSKKYIVYSSATNFVDGLDNEIEFNIMNDIVESIYFYVGQR